MSSARGPARPPPPRRRHSAAVYRRRRLAVGSTALLFVALLVVVSLLLTAGGPAKKANSHSSSTTTITATTGTTGSTTSTTAAPAVGVGARTVTWTDTNPTAGLVVNPVPGGSAGPRTLLTQIWYPSVGGSVTTPTAGQQPDYGGGPYPVIVFAHGFDTVPATYTPLLLSFVRAGFVVVAPTFPDENSAVVSSLSTLAENQIAESDIVNEPYDVAYVAGQVQAAANGSASSHATWLKGLAEPGKYAIVGHSDGAQAVAALVYSGNYASTYAALVVHPFAVVILSGSELSEGGTYAPPASAPPMLFVQSAVDGCNLPQNAAKLFHDAGGGFFLELTMAHHFTPYIGLGPAAPIVERVTAAFLKAARTGTASASTLSATKFSASLAALYPPTKPPTLASLPLPTQTALAAACAVPVTQP